MNGIGSAGEKNEQRVREPVGSRLLRRAKTTVPWLGAAGIFTYLFWDIPIGEALRALSRARVELLIPGILAAVIYWFLLESVAYSYLFSRFNVPLRWSEARSLRGVTYIVTAINWHLGSAAVVLHLRQSKSVPVLKSTSSLFFYNALDAIILVSLGFIGASFFGESAVVQSLQTLAGAALFLLVLSFTLLMASKPRWRWIQKIRSVALVTTFRQAKTRDFAILMAIRAVYFFGFFAAFWIGSRAFGINLPLALTAASVPAIMMAGAIPISPAGVGTQAAVMLFFWSDYGEDAAIVAFGLVFPIAVTLARCLLGLFYVRDLTALRKTLREAEESMEPEPAFTARERGSQDLG